MTEPPDPTYHGDLWASSYDDEHTLDFSEAVSVLVELSGGGPVLELGLGTGRVALPLAAGIDIAGIDASEAMVARLRAKPGGAAIHVQIGTWRRRTWAVPSRTFPCISADLRGE
jgi:SAM-dependent methyltransferase